MLRIDFQSPLSALEFRDPMIEVCKQAASSHELFATFHQTQQQAFTGHPGQRKSERKRIGNGKHKEWIINFQEKPVQTNRPTVAGRLVIKSSIIPSQKQFGGFDYGKHGEPKPTYLVATFHTPSELDHWRPIDPDPNLLALTYDGLRERFENSAPRLFPIAEYVQQNITTV